MATALLLRRSLQSLNNTVKSSIYRHYSVLAGKLGKTFPQRFSEKEVHSEINKKKHAEMAIWNIKMMKRYKSEFVRRIEDEVLNSKTASSGKRVSTRRKSEMNNNSSHCQGDICDDSSDDDYSDCDGYFSDFDSHKDGEYPKDGESNYNPEALGGSSSDIHGATHGGFNPCDGGSNHIDIVGSGSSDGGSCDGGSSCGGGCGGGG